MVDPQQVQQAVAELPDGAEIRVQLADGTESAATKTEAGLVIEGKDEPIANDAIEGILLESSLGGPE